MPNKFAKKFSLSFIPILATIVFIMPLLTIAQDSTVNNNPSDTTVNNASTKMKIVIENPFEQNTIEGLIRTLIKDILMPIGAVVAVLMVMYAGFLYVTARGNPAQITKAHDALKWAVIGAAILLGAWVISEAIKSTIDELRV